MAQKRDPKDWPELQPPLRSTQQAFTEALVRKESAEAHELLIRRVGVLRILVAVLLLSAGSTLWVILPQLWQGGFDAVTTLLGACNAILAISAAGYFLQSRDPDFAASVVQLLLIFDGLELLISLGAIGSLFTLVVTIIVLFLTYQRLRALHTHWL